MQGQDPDRLKRLRWLCRRGMKELDVCLTTFLCQQNALEGERLQALEEILQWQDDRLWDALRGVWMPQDPLQQQLLVELGQLTRDLSKH